MKLNAKELRTVNEAEAEKHVKDLKRRPLYFILENIYDTYNIGGLFRLADALLVEKIYLCGEMEIPPNHKIKKASIGTYKIVPWKYCVSAKEAIEKLRKTNAETESVKFSSRLNSPDSLSGSNRKSRENFPSSVSNKLKIIAVEQDKRAVEYTKANYSFPLALIFGNETYGVLPETLDLVDQVVEIPMWGINKSLNVIVSAAIVSYFAIGKMSGA